jgi:hypothetical protein
MTVHLYLRFLLHVDEELEQEASEVEEEEGEEEGEERDDEENEKDIGKDEAQDYANLDLTQVMRLCMPAHVFWHRPTTSAFTVQYSADSCQVRLQSYVIDTLEHYSSGPLAPFPQVQTQ